MQTLVEYVRSDMQKRFGEVSSLAKLIRENNAITDELNDIFHAVH